MNEQLVTFTSKPENHYTIKKQQQQTICQNCYIQCKECSVCIHKYGRTRANPLLIVTMCKHIHLVIKYINSLLNHIPIEPSNVPMKSLNVRNEKMIHEVKI